MKKSLFFLSAVFITTAFWQWSYYRFSLHYSGLPEAKVTIQKLNQQLVAEKAKVSLVGYQLEDFKQTVAEVLPEFKDPAYEKKQLQLRGLASVVRKPDHLKISIAQDEATIERAALMYSRGEYQPAVQLMQALVARSSLAPSKVRAHFILAESLYQQGQFEECLRQATVMMQLYPEESMTGYVLLRVGQILNEQNRVEEAKEAFQVVEKSFDESELRKKAKLLASQLKGVGYQ